MRFSCLFVTLIYLSIVKSTQASVFINAGGPDYQDDDGNLWESDTGYMVWTTGKIARKSVDISGTPTPILFQSNRWSDGSSLVYEIPLDNGEYQVNLLFAENNGGVHKTGQRLFDVKLQDTTVFEKLDVFAEAGNARNTAVIKTTTVVVQDEVLTIELTRQKHNPMICAIQVVEEMVAREAAAVVDSWIDVNENENYTPRHECGFVQAGNRFYLFGGREKSQWLDVYDYEQDSWTRGASAPKQFNHFQATEYQGLIWVLGAFEDNGFPTETSATHVHVYDQNVWMEGPEIPRPRGAAGLVVYNDKFYVVGGNKLGHSGGFVEWLDEYDPYTGQWKNLTDAPHQRDHFQAAVLGDKLYAVGGRRTDKGSVFKDTVGEVDVYDFSTGQWQTLPNDLPAPRAGTATAVFDGQVLVMGGESGTQWQAHNEVHALDPDTKEWSTLASMHYPRHGTQAIVSGQGVYIASGSPKRGGGRQHNMEVYNADIPAGEESIAGVLSGPQSTDILTNSMRVVSIHHISGNQGVFVNSIELTGSDASDFVIAGDPFVPVLISRDDGVLVVPVQYLGTAQDVKATLEVKYSATQTVNVELVGKTSMSGAETTTTREPMPFPTPLPVASPTPFPTPLPTPEPTPLPTESPSSDATLSIQKLVFVNADSNKNIKQVKKCNGCINSSTPVNINAIPYGEVGSIKFTLQGPISLTHVENKDPYALVGDRDGVFHGMLLAAGDYTITVQAHSLTHAQGEAGPEMTESFSVIIKNE